MSTGVPARAPVAADRATSTRRTTTIQAEERRVARAAYLFLAPTFLLFLVFVAGPLVAAIYISFTYYDVFSAPKWVGLENYQFLLKDNRTLSSLRNTGMFVIFSTLIEIILALFLAIGVQRKIAPLPPLLRTRAFLGGLAAIVLLTIGAGAVFGAAVGLVAGLLALVAIVVLITALQNARSRSYWGTLAVGAVIALGCGLLLSPTAGLLALFIAWVVAVGSQREMPMVLRYFFRTSYFLPIITSGAAMGVVFGFMFNKDFGVINYYLSKLGIEAIPWLTSTKYSLWTIILAASWQRLGFTFILFAAGLQNIPRELYEAADIDGATGWSRLTRITIPLLSPTILFTAVIGIIGGLQVFELPQLITRGGPGDSSRTVVMVIREVGFGPPPDFGYGSAIAVILLLLIMGLTGFQFWASQRWVHYR